MEIIQYLIHYFIGILPLITVTSSSELNFLRDGDTLHREASFGNLISKDNNCSDNLKKFTSAFTNFTSCALSNSYPIRICRSCDFQSVNILYDSLKNVSDEECFKEYFQSSYVSLIDTLFNNALNLWKKSNCDGCKGDKSDNFFKKWEELVGCLNSVLIENGFHQDGLNCSNCFTLYENVTAEFNEIVKHSENVCIDINDAMNITVRKWNDLKCNAKFGSYIGTANIITTVFVALLPLIFYTGAKLFSAIEDVKLFRPKRRTFAQDLHR